MNDTATGFPDFAPGEHRQLLAAVHHWARANGWTTHRDTGWQNPSRITQVDWDERGLFIGSRDGADHMWKTPRHWPAASVRQAVDMLVALDILPAQFSSAYKAGRDDALSDDWDGYCDFGYPLGGSSKVPSRIDWCGLKRGHGGLHYGGDRQEVGFTNIGTVRRGGAR